MESIIMTNYNGEIQHNAPAWFKNPFIKRNHHDSPLCPISPKGSGVDTELWECQGGQPWHESKMSTANGKLSPAMHDQAADNRFINWSILASLSQSFWRSCHTKGLSVGCTAQVGCPTILYASCPCLLDLFRTFLLSTFCHTVPWH